MTHHKRFSTALAVVFVLSAPVATGTASADDGMQDTRTPIVFAPAERASYLKYMRDVLAGLQSITQGLSDGEMSGVAGAARDLAAPMDEFVSQATLDKLPEEFRLLLQSLPSDFGELAQDAERVDDTKLILSRLSQVMAKCLACHRAYRVAAQ